MKALDNVVDMLSKSLEWAFDRDIIHYLFIVLILVAVYFLVFR